MQSADSKFDCLNAFDSSLWTECVTVIRSPCISKIESFDKLLHSRIRGMGAKEVRNRNTSTRNWCTGSKRWRVLSSARIVDRIILARTRLTPVATVL